MVYLVDFHSNLKKMTFLSIGNSLNIDFQATEGLSRNLVSTLSPVIPVNFTLEQE
jgi:hypothetical protein